MARKHGHPYTSLIILTRNEISGVRALLDDIPFNAVNECFAVDYNSTDGTVEYFQEHNIPVIRQEKPGRAEAFRIGVKHSKGDFLVFFSPDGNENPADIPKLIALLESGADLAIASRFLPGARNEEDGQTLKFRAWANQAFTALVNLFFKGMLTDSINGYRAIKRSAYERLCIDTEGFAVEFQMSIRALKLGMNIVEIPTVEGDRIGGFSTSTAIPTGLQFSALLLRELLIGTRFRKAHKA